MTSAYTLKKLMKDRLTLEPLSVTRIKILTADYCWIKHYDQKELCCLLNGETSKPHKNTLLRSLVLSKNCSHLTASPDRSEDPLTNSTKSTGLKKFNTLNSTTRSESPLSGSMVLRTRKFSGRSRTANSVLPHVTYSTRASWINTYWACRRKIKQMNK